MDEFNNDFVVTLRKLLFPVGWFEIFTKVNTLVITIIKPLVIIFAMMMKIL